MSQEQFAHERLHICRTYMGKLERGTGNPSLRTVERLSEQLDVRPLDLLWEGEGPAGLAFHADR